MLTGFHGLHVTIGAIMLLVMMFRSAKGNLKGKTVDLAIAAVLEALARDLQIEPRSQD